MWAISLGVVLAFVVVVPVLVLTFMFSGDTGGGAPQKGALASGSVPPQYEQWIRKAGTVCPEVSAPLIAAQIEQESDWNPDAVSKAGAQGLSQFLPDTWPSVAVDADGRGTVSPFDPADAIMAQATYDCRIAARAEQDLASGRIHGDITDIILAAYNCGYGCVLSAGGPQVGNGETDNYVPSVKARMHKYTGLAGLADGSNWGTAGFGSTVVAAASAWQGEPYAWGGGDPSGPTQGHHDGGVADFYGDYNKVGFDCSGLVVYAVAAASGDRIILPHYTVDQLDDPRGHPIPLDQIQPGDVVFPAGGDPDHEAIYVGDGQIVQAPKSGGVVSRASLVSMGPVDVRRFG
jgi:cell wall-associated NlpC family hydrolase